MRIPPGEGVTSAAAKRHKKKGKGKARLVIDRLDRRDRGLYKCRTDFRKSPTRNHRVELTILSK